MSIRPPKPRDDDDEEELEKPPELELIITPFAPVDTIDAVSVEVLNRWPTVERES